MGKFRQFSPVLWPLIDAILCSYIELVFHGGVSCLPAGLLFIFWFTSFFSTKLGSEEERFEK